MSSDAQLGSNPSASVATSIVLEAVQTELVARFSRERADDILRKARKCVGTIAKNQFEVNPDTARGWFDQNKDEKKDASRVEELEMALQKFFLNRGIEMGYETDDDNRIVKHYPIEATLTGVIKYQSKQEYPYSARFFLDFCRENVYYVSGTGNTFIRFDRYAAEVLCATGDEKQFSKLTDECRRAIEEAGETVAERGKKHHVPLNWVAANPEEAVVPSTNFGSIPFMGVRGDLQVVAVIKNEGYVEGEDTMEGVNIPDYTSYNLGSY